MEIKATHIDTGGHGYYSVSKEDIAILGIADRITGYSGHNLTRVYLEEDCDGQLLADACKEKGIELKVKSSYNLKFKCTNNYNSALFSWKPEVGKMFLGHGEKSYTTIYINDNVMHVRANEGQQIYSIPLSNPFEHVRDIITDKQASNITFAQAQF